MPDYEPITGRYFTMDVAGEAMRMLTAVLPGEHILLNADIDGTFPAHHPDPTVPENLVQLQEAVASEGCDLGIAFDGDGDRIGVVDGQGRILWGDQLLSIYARDLLSRRPGATVIADVKASQVLFDEVARYGGNPVMAATGHSIIKSKMAELSAPLAGEMSGHIFFGDIDRTPLVRTSRALGQLPVVLEHEFEVGVVPLDRVGSPRTF